jgi:phospho-N-acetylmuramoyl-pentapeptide-transferase
MTNLDPLTINAVAVFAPAVIAFVAGILITPLVTAVLYRYSMWKKESGTVAPDGRETPIFNELHKDKEVGTPRMGGIIVWLSVLITTSLFVLGSLIGGSFADKLDFFSRGQTWLPLFTLIAGAGVGLADDWLEVSDQGDYLPGGLSLRKRLLIVGGMGLVGGWWFYTKLGVTGIMVPFVGTLQLGWVLIPFFVLVMMATYSSGVIDGLDGLSGGVFAASYSAYGIIAFALGMINLAAFCFVVVGGILAFLWFNIPPARFYMTETGIMGLTTTLAVIAFLTDQVLVLPLIGLPLVATTASVIIQLIAKNVWGTKVFKVAPLHHHFEAVGWPEAKVTMRYWVVSIVCAMGGTAIALLSIA